MDFIVDLPLSLGFDSIFVVKDRLSKQGHFIPTKKTITGEGTAELFMEHIFRHHGVPSTIVSDRGPQFLSSFWQRFMSLLGVKIKLSSAFHPETDGSTEILNQSLEQYLRIFCSYQQDDWGSLLPLAEFSYNNSVNSVTGFSPFFALYGFHPRCDFKNSLAIEVPAAEDRLNCLVDARSQLIRNLEAAQRAYTRGANRKRSPPPIYVPGDMVFLDSRHIRSTRPSRKFDYKWLGPFPIEKVLSRVAMRLTLPSTWRIHPVFHVSLLKRAPSTSSPFASTTLPPPLPLLVDGSEEYEVESILDSRLIRGKPHFLVHWKGFPISDRTWEPRDNLIHSHDLLRDFHAQFPSKPF
jgi:hypothetical protein